MSDKSLTPAANNPRRELAATAIDRLLAILPAPTYGDMRAVTAAAIAIVERYPPDVIARLCDPVAGIAAGSKFFPTLAELTEWCSRAARPAYVPRDYAADVVALRIGTSSGKAPVYPNDKAAGKKFWAMGAAYIARLPDADKQNLPVIKPGQAGWETWRRYFAHIGWFPRAFIALDTNALDKPREGFTLPTAFPSDFDLTYSD